LNPRSRIVVVRHGQTEWSVAGRHTGRTDLALNEVGRAQAVALSAVLGDEQFDRVLCSPLLRARDTCALAGFGERAEVLDDLAEWDYGDYEGLTTVEIRDRVPGWYLWRDGCPGGENVQDVGARADRALTALRSFSADDAPFQTLVFAHGHLLRVLAVRWAGFEPGAAARFLLAPAALGVLGFERETPAIVRWNTRSPH
jgi:broad specificity phosphatase PhoE